jgi:hypothetical protein
MDHRARVLTTMLSVNRVVTVWGDAYSYTGSWMHDEYHGYGELVDARNTERYKVCVSVSMRSDLC